MLLDNLTFDDIEEKDLLKLISDQVPEDKTIDYKVSLPGDLCSDRKEFLADVTSFANASGGYLLFGIHADKGIPVNLPGINPTEPKSDPDSVILRLDNIIRDGIQPRIYGYHIRSVKLSDGTYVYILRIPKSWSPPHMVSFSGDFRFYSRNSAGKYTLDVSELRQIFLFAEQLSEKIRNFRNNRLASIVAKETPVPIAGEANLVLHIIPLSAFSQGANINLEYIFKNPPALLGSSNWTPRYNFEGVLIHSPVGSEGSSSYTQFFRNGIVEAVNTSLLNEFPKTIPIATIENAVLTTIMGYLNLLNKIKVGPPYSIMLSLLDVKGFILNPDMYAHLGGHPVDQLNLFLPDILLEESSNKDISIAFRPAFDALWNAVGISRSPSYDENGVRKGNGVRN